MRDYPPGYPLVNLRRNRWSVCSEIRTLPLREVRGWYTLRRDVCIPRQAAPIANLKGGAGNTNMSVDNDLVWAYSDNIEFASLVNQPVYP